MLERGVLSRHAESLRHDPMNQSKEYPSLTKYGVEQAREAANSDLIEIINRSPEGTILFIGGKSDQDRTGHTGEVYGDELNNLTKEKKDLLVLTKEEIDGIIVKNKTEKKGGRAINVILDFIKNNIDKKIVVVYPLYIKQLGYAYKDRWTTTDPETGKVVKTRYFSEILKKYNQDHARCIRDWMETNGVLTLDNGETIQGPKPEDIAKEYLHGLKRLNDFAKRQFPSRPIVVHGVGHQWDLDAVVTYLAQGKVSYEDFVKTMGRPEAEPKAQVIGESEVISNITIDPNTAKTTVKYRGQEFSTIL